MSYLFDAQTTPKVSTTTNTNSQFPKWYSDWINASLAKGSEAVDEPYTPYTGPRVAPTTADQQSAYDLTRGGIGSYQPMVNQGAQLIGQSGEGFNQGEFDKYMNPYMGGVTDEIARLGTRNLSENLLPAVNDSFIRSNSFGSTRNGDFTQRALRDTNESILGEQAKSLASGFNTALGGYQTGQANKLAAGQGLGSLATTGQTLGLKDAAALQSIGSEQQGQTQKSLDTAYQDFLQQRDYPKSQAEWMAALVRGVNPPTSSTTTTTGPATPNQLAPNPLAQVAGAGVGIGSLLGMFAKGGKVKRAPVRRGGIGSFAMAA